MNETNPKNTPANGPIPAPGDGQAAAQRRASSSTIRTDAETMFFRTETERAEEHRACLVIIRGARLGARIVPGEQPLVIGRTTEADFQISARSVSRHHCTLFRENGEFWIRDLGSTNKTYVNDKPVTRHRLRDGDHVRISQTVMKFIGEDNIEAGYHSELHESTVRDALTGLYNRRHLMGVLETEFARCLRRDDRELALIIMDIDFFKEVNDTYGHLAGDGVLKQVSRLASRRIRESDTLARIGGEEFAILLPGTDSAGAWELAETIREAIESAEFRIGDKTRTITLSAGTARWTPAMNAVNDLIRAADENLYRAKSAGRNRVCSPP